MTSLPPEDVTLVVAWRYLSDAWNAQWTVQKNKPSLGPRYTVEPLVPLAALLKVAEERDAAQRVRRWNVDDNGETLAVCRGDHDGDKCEWETFVPAAALTASEASASSLREERDRYRTALEKIAEAFDNATLGRGNPERDLGWTGSHDNWGEIFRWYARTALSRGGTDGE